MKLVIIYYILHYCVTRHKPTVRMDTYIDFNDSYIFLTATYIFSNHREDITIFSKEPLMPNSPHFLLLFSLSTTYAK